MGPILHVYGAVLMGPTWNLLTFLIWVPYSTHIGAHGDSVWVPNRMLGLLAGRLQTAQNEMIQFLLTCNIELISQISQDHLCGLRKLPVESRMNQIMSM